MVKMRVVLFSCFLFTASANLCETITCTSPRICQMNQQSNQPECDCPQVCALIYSPVCGSNGKTYGNECDLNVDACLSNSTITLLHSGTCAVTTNPCDSILCTTDYNPVCGSDGKTYSNRCELSRGSCRSGTNITVAQQGECVRENVCSTVSCGYGKECVVDNERRPMCVCNKICMDLYDPVCGSDAVTYGNECQLNRTACENLTSITVDHRGSCEQDIRSGSSTKLTVGLVFGIGLPILLIVVIVVICVCVRKKSAGDGQKKTETLSASELGQTSTQMNCENAKTYEKLADGSAEQPQIYTQLQPSGEENPTMNVETYETLTDRTDEYEHEYGRLRIP